jgi:hypothetical protein
MIQDIEVKIIAFVVAILVTLLIALATLSHSIFAPPTLPSDDSILITRGNFTMTLANGETKPLPEHLKDDWERIGNYCQFKWALWERGVYKYHQLFEVDNLTWPKDRWLGDSYC